MDNTNQPLDTLPFDGVARRKLLEPQDFAEQGPPEAIRLPLDLIDPNPNNPRKSLSEIEALAESIKDFGLLQPVTVRRTGERYELVGGHRRWSAFLLLAEKEPYDPLWKTIPAVVRTFDDDTAYLALVSSQVQTQNWRPREEAAALERLALAGMSLKQIGERLHRTESWASKRLAVYADSVLSAYVQSGRLAPTIAEEFLVIPDAPTKRDYAERAAEETWSQTQARAEVQRMQSSKAIRQLSRRSRELRDVLSRIPVGDIPPKDAEELLRLARLIMRLAKGGRPVVPSVEAAERAAGIPERPRRAARQKSHTTRRLRIPSAPTS